MSNVETAASTVSGETLHDIASPRHDIRAGAIISLLFFVGLLGWAALFRLDSAAIAPGVLTVAGQPQVVQHRDGGIVSAIHVREGQQVKVGDLLIALSAPEAQAQERALQSQAIQLLARRARLQAEQLGRRAITPPVEFKSLSPEDQATANLALNLQAVELDNRHSVQSAQRSVFGERIGQSSREGQGHGSVEASTVEQIRLIDEQLAALSSLEADGFVSRTRIRELQRVRAALLGQRGQSSANVARATGASNEFRMQMLAAERSFQERIAADLRDVEDGLGSVLPRLAAAREQLARNQIRAPATGAVVGLNVFTPGGVIGGGQRLMSIVPARQPLRIEVRIALDDVDDLHVGAKALLRFPGLHERSLPDLEGQLTRLSADRVIDDKTGEAFFTGEVTVPLKQLDLIRGLRNGKITMRPGMPVQAMLPLRGRTALNYLVEPLVGSFWTSFREN